MLVRVDFLRHGVAAPAGAGGDAARTLTAGGAEAVRRLGERLAGEGWWPDRVLASPYRRAIETAECVLQAAGVARAIERTPELEPERDPGDLELLLAADRAAHVLLVSHQPLAGRTVERWCGTEHEPRPGELVQMTFDASPGPGRGRLVRHLVY